MSPQRKETSALSRPWHIDHDTDRLLPRVFVSRPARKVCSSTTSASICKIRRHDSGTHGNAIRRCGSKILFRERHRHSDEKIMSTRRLMVSLAPAATPLARYWKRQTSENENAERCSNRGPCVRQKFYAHRISFRVRRRQSRYALPVTSAPTASVQRRHDRFNSITHIGLGEASKVSLL